MFRDNLRLYDIVTRKQIYVEGVKAQQQAEFNAVLAELSEELRKLLARIKYRSLDVMTKAELNRFILSLREVQNRVYSAYTEKLLAQLQDFMRADLAVSRRAFASVLIEHRTGRQVVPTDEEATEAIKQESERSAIAPLFGLAAVTGSADLLWSKIINAPIPANGIYVVPFVKSFATSAQAAVENTVRQAYANGWTVEETLAAILGEPGVKQGTPGQLGRIAAQAGAVAATALQHVSSIATAGVASAAFGAYVWVSVIDDVTTEICRGRNRKVYRFGVGPIPPAHIRCRSIIVPLLVGSGDDLPDESFYTWSRRQPDAFLADVLDDEVYFALKAGKLKAKDFAKFRTKHPLTLEDYEDKINLILSR